MKKLLLACTLALSLQGCGPMLAAAMGGAVAGPPPQAPAAVTAISRTALDFALNSFDAALYGLDFAMDSGRLQPGSPAAKKIAAAGRKVMSFLGVADAAAKLGSSATYEEAFSNAKAALDEFRSLWPAAAALEDRPPLTWEDRFDIIRRLDHGNPHI